MAFENFASLLKLDFSPRDKNINRQIFYSFLARAIGLSISLVQVPLLLNILGTESYGIWLTLLSITTWISILDIGISAGLRNKLAESLAINDLETAQKYVSTAYISLAAIILPPLLLTILVLPNINLQSWLNTTIDPHTLLLTMVITILSTILNFVPGLVNQILYSLQKNALISFQTLLVSLVLILILYFLPHFTTVGLTYVAVIYSATNIGAFVLFSLYVFYKWPYLRPSAKAFNKSYVTDILSLGLRFFFIQLGAIIIFSTDNFLISRLFGPKLVASFNITFRLFNFVNMAVGIVMTPFWSAFTEAHAKNDSAWIKHRLRSLNLSMLPLTLLLAILTYYHDQLVNFWLGSKISTPHNLPILMAVYILVSVWNNIYTFFLNGISRTREQLLSSTIAMLLNIPLSIFLAKNLNMGINGIVLASIVSLLIFAVVGPITTYKMLNRHIKP